MKQLSVIGRQLSVTRKKIIFTGFILFVIFCTFLTAFADEVSSKAAVVIEASTGRILFAKNPNLKLPPASTAKLITAMVVLDKVRLDENVTISKKASNVQATRANFKAGETVSVRTLLYAALLRSANDATVALAENIAGSERKFVELMNKKVASIGTTNTKLINTTGLPGDGQYITAYDLARIMRYSLNYPELKEIINTREAAISTERGRTINIENTNKLLWSDEGAVGGKTGYTKDAGHCFVYAAEKDSAMVIVALLGAPNRKALWNEAEKLVEKGLHVIENSEQPRVYFTKEDYASSVKKAAYRKSPSAKKSTKSNLRTAKTSAKKKKDALHMKDSIIKDPDVARDHAIGAGVIKNPGI